MSTQNFVQLIGLNLDECWNNVKHLVDFFEEQEDGTYHIVKDPIKMNLQVFKDTSKEGSIAAEEVKS